MVSDMRSVMNSQIQWERLDNTANLFPVIATAKMPNVYRLSVELWEEVEATCLQKALSQILPKFGYMNVCMRTGVFWYYFETNSRKSPRVFLEQEFPCRFMEPKENRDYLFRVSYYHRRISLEVFHVLADGMGGVNFLRELTYAYLRERHSELAGLPSRLSSQTSLNSEDSYLSSYRKAQKKGYVQQRAYHMTGEKLGQGGFGVIHGYVSVAALKEICHAHGWSINEYMAGIYVYSIYRACLHGSSSRVPIELCVPVNLRPYFGSQTVRNFFVMISAGFKPQEQEYTREEVIRTIAEGLRSQMTKESLEKMFSYNVSNQKNIMLRAVPLTLKKPVIQAVYQGSAKSTTTTMTNIGQIRIQEEYQPYIRHFHCMLSMSTGQNLKLSLCSYQDTLTMTFSSVLKSTSVQKQFFRELAADGLDVEIESNGVYHEM